MVLLLLTFAGILCMVIGHLRMQPRSVEEEAYDLLNILLIPVPGEAPKSMGKIRPLNEVSLSLEDIRGCLQDSRQLDKKPAVRRRTTKEPEVLPSSEELLQEIDDQTPIDFSGLDDDLSDTENRTLSEAFHLEDAVEEVPPAILINRTPEDDAEELDDDFEEPESETLTLEDISHLFSELPEHPDFARIDESVSVYVDDFSDIGYYAMYLAMKDYLETPTEPSIGPDCQEETTTYRNSFDILRKHVPLIAHVANVAYQISKVLESYAGLNRRLSEGAFLLALYHDLGKLQKHRNRFLTGVYRLTDHPQISAMLLKERYPTIDPKVLSAIEYHHKPPKLNPEISVYSQFLKEADHAARQIETKTHLKNVPSISEVIRKDELVDLIITRVKQCAAAQYTSEMTTKIPDFFAAHGFAFVARGALLTEISKLLESSTRICREQHLSAEQYAEAVFQLLSDVSLISEDQRKFDICLEYKGVKMQSRSTVLKSHIAVPVETLKVFQDSLGKFEIEKQLKSVSFRSRSYK